MFGLAIRLMTVTQPFAVISIKEHVDKYIAEGMTTKDAIKKAAADRNLPKRDVYNEYHRGE